MTKKIFVMGTISLIFLCLALVSSLLLNMQFVTKTINLEIFLKVGSLFKNIGIIGIIGTLGATIEYSKLSLSSLAKLFLEILAYTISISTFVLAVNVTSITKFALIQSILPFINKSYWIIGVILFGLILLTGLKYLKSSITPKLIISGIFIIAAFLFIFSLVFSNRNLLLMIAWSLFVFLVSSYLTNQNLITRVAYVLVPFFVAVLGIILTLIVRTPSLQIEHALLIDCVSFLSLSLLVSPNGNEKLHLFSTLVISRVFLGLMLLLLNPLVIGTLTKYTMLQVARSSTIYVLLRFYMCTFIIALGLIIVESFGVARRYLGVRNMQITIPVVVCMVSSTYLIYNGLQFLSSGIISLKNLQGNALYLELFNLVIILLLYLFIQGVLNRFWYSNFLFVMLMLILSYANYAKLQARDEPIIRPDFGMINSLPEIVKMVNMNVVYGLIAGLIGLTILAVILQRFFMKGPIFHWPLRVLVVLGSALLLYNFAQTENQMNLIAWKDKKVTDSSFLMASLTNAGFSAHPGALEMSSTHYGPAVTFMSTVIIKTMDKPNGYSQARINQIVEKYKRISRKINKTRKNRSLNKQTVVYVLSESYADPRMMPTVKLSSNPIPFEQSLAKHNTSGLMDSPSYGGGTANIEFESLTGLSMNNFDPSMVTPYVFLVPKVNNLPVITDYFKTKNAIHPYSGVTYNRTNVFKKFGFQHFYSFTGDKLTFAKRLDKSPYVSDDSAYRQLLKQINSTNKGQFIQLSTMQNHMPYHLGTYTENNYKATGNLTKASLDSVESYSQGLHYTDQDLKMLIKKVSKMKKHVTIVWYGDHLPGLYEGNLVSGKNLVKYDNKLHQTNYFIYSNFKHAKIKHTKVVSPNMFTPIMFKQTDTKVSAYVALLTEINNYVPAAERDKFMAQNGKYITYKRLSTKAKTIINDYKLIQYDITAGKQYSIKQGNFIK
ncbi:hypothetical protein IV87_GL001588 [Pediococcus ethanolidurans]|nr:hypothetical protein IV87_GL001588 [Pediococcus ethanolidurans]